MKLLHMRTLKSVKNFRPYDVQAVLSMVLLMLLDILCPLLYHYLYRERLYFILLYEALTSLTCKMTHHNIVAQPTHNAFGVVLDVFFMTKQEFPLFP